jgi:hypothetical protein
MELMRPEGTPDFPCPLQTVKFFHQHPASCSKLCVGLNRAGLEQWSKSERNGQKMRFDHGKKINCRCRTDPSKAVFLIRQANAEKTGFSTANHAKYANMTEKKSLPVFRA